MGDIRTTMGQKPPETTAARKSKKWRIIRWFTLIAILVGAAGHFIKYPKYAYAAGYTTTRDYAEIRSAAGGPVAEIFHHSGEMVETGALLMRLESDVEEAALAEARARVAQAEAEIRFLETQAADKLKQHQNDVALAEMELEHSRKNLELTRQLHDKSLTSGRQLANDEHAVRRGEAELRRLNEIDMTVAEKQIEERRRNVESLKEAARRAEAALAQREVRATLDGLLMKYTFYEGEVIRPDMVLFEVFKGPVNTMKIHIPERHSARVATNCVAQAQLATHRSLIPRRFGGHVGFIRPVVEGDGSDNYRVAYCSLDLEDEEIPPGVTVDARIFLGRTSLWKHILEP
ncbi:MAG: hypothetical protein FWG05_02610 [Kiritimatiellaeota bacterium]|nr:hypothetical protein [Kiritimatiellota bacterium]